MTRDCFVFHCPEETCDYFAVIGWVPDTRWDQGYLDGDPPEECPNGHDMHGVSGEIDNPRNYIDPDYAHDFDR